MKKYSNLTIIIFFLITGFCRSQSGWVHQPLPVNANSYDMKFFDANTGIISLETPALLRTTNGGQNWVVIKSIVIFGMELIDSSTLYAHGRRYNTDEVIYRTFDKGLTWDSVAINSANTYRGISFLNRDTGWISGWDGNWDVTWKTTNGGLTMQIVATFGWGKIFFLKYKINGEYYGWVSHYNSMYKTTNSGVNWFLIGPAGNLTQLNMIDTSTGWASNGSVNILKTTNGGLNWVNLPMPSGNNILLRNIQRFKIINNNKIYGVGGNRWFSGSGKITGVIWVTTSAGLNWGFQQPDTSINIGMYDVIDFIDSIKGWSHGICTNDGGGPITKISNNSEQIPKDYELCQNYPNPFNPATSISYKVKSYKVIKLSVYDIVGKEVAILFNEKQRAGEYEVTFDGTGLSSGVYYYVLYADGVRMGAKRMVLLK